MADQPAPTTAVPPAVFDPDMATRHPLSCMGCHYSAGVAVASAVDDYGNRQVVYGPPSSGDFSWLLQLKAQWAPS